MGNRRSPDVSDAAALGPPVLEESIMPIEVDSAANTGNGTGASHSEPWSTPAPLSTVRAPGQFPAHVLPQWLRVFVESVSESTQTPADLAGVLVLAAVATIVQRRTVVRIKPDYDEPLNIFVVAVSAPGTRKSPVYRFATAPLEALQADQMQEAAVKIEEAQAHVRVLEKRLSRAEDSASKAEDATELNAQLEEVRDITHELQRAREEVPPSPRLLVDDVTPEALATLLVARGRITLASAEGGIFDTLAGRYTGVANIDVFLKGHAGDSLTVDRKGRPSEQVDRPALTVALAVQPAVIAALDDKPGFRGRGLLARFLYAVPENMVGYRKTDPAPVPRDVVDRYDRLIRSLDGQQLPVALVLSPGAYAYHQRAAADLEPRLGPDGDLASITEWSSKLMGAIARIAGLLHVATHAGSQQPMPNVIEVEVMEAAHAFTDYFIGHARAAFALMGADPNIKKAQAVLSWMRRERKTTFTKRDAYRDLRGEFPKADEIDAPLALLAQLDYVRLHEVHRDGPGRKASAHYEVNPSVQNGQNGHNARSGEVSPHSVHSVHSAPGVAH